MRNGHDIHYENLKKRSGVNPFWLERVSGDILIAAVCLLVFSLLLAGCNITNQETTSDVTAEMDKSLSKIEPPSPEAATPTGPVGDAPMSIRADLPDLGPAPELTNQVWLNTDQPLRLEDLTGEVVLLDMWTFGWINCRNVIPSLREWYDRYNDQGLVIIGNHYPEFGYEADLENLKEAVQSLEIQYPVAQDNDGDTWRAYDNRYWPTMYLIDKHGNLRYRHIGEGNYAETEAAIQSLLAETYP